jgi:hypothetical protein
MTNFILKNIITDFFNTYRIETVSKKPIIEKILLALFFGVFSLAMGAILLETITQIF